VNSSLAGSIYSLNSVAMGDKKADLILNNCNLLSVYTREVIPKTQIAITGDRIAYVGPDASHAMGPKTRIIDVKNRFVSPGFADPHLHIDQFVLPSEFAKQALLCGVTSLFSDPIDVVSVGGGRGFREFLRLGEGLPIRIFQVVPGGLPVDAKFSNGNTMSLSETKSAIRHPHVLGLGEVFSWTKVTLREPKTMSISKFGHIDHCIRESIKLGLEPIDAIIMASKNNFDYYNMGRDLGGIAPGKLADILIFKDLRSFRPAHVFVGGRLVISDGQLVTPIRKRTIPSWIKNTVKLGRFSKNDFEVKSKKSGVVANTILLLTEIITKAGSAELPAKDGLVSASMDSDVWKVAAFDRTHGTKRHSIGFLENFGAEVGAFASSWSFHENDLIVIGSNDSDMAVAANHVVKNQGGLVVVKSGKIVSSLPLQFAGIVSTDPFEKVSSNFANINSSIVDSGCRFPRPHLIPLFLPFLALPSVRILSGGIVDVKRRRYIEPIY